MDSILTTKKGENNSIYRKELTYFYDSCQKSDGMNVYQEKEFSFLTYSFNKILYDGKFTANVCQGHSNNNYNASFGSNNNNEFTDNKERVGIKQIFKLQPEFVILGKTEL